MPVTRIARAVAPWRARLVGLDDVVAPVVVGCSGGADSLATLALALDAGLAPVAVHVDHGLRIDSAGEALRVAATATALGARVDRVRVSVDPGPNLEARARDARYAALDEARARYDASAVLVGHTTDDQAETVLLNLLRGSGRAGLGGMAARRGSLVRPLLGLRHADTLELCARLGLTPLHDPMNDDLAFRRVWLRREVIPSLERAAGRDLRTVLARQSDVLRTESELLDELGAAAWPAPGAAQARDLAALPLALARRAVRIWLGYPSPSLDEIDAVLAVARCQRRAVDLAGGRRVARHDGLLVREHVSPTPAHARADGVAVPLPGRAAVAGFVIESWVEREAPLSWPDGRWMCVIDAERAGREARLAVDDGGVPQLSVARTGESIWKLGYRVDGRVRVRAATRHFLWIRVDRAAS
jgi:tRNA(Ile)-lysidine synthase